MTVIHDKSLAIDSERWVALFNVRPHQLNLYTRWHARSTSTNLDKNSSVYQSALEIYKQFKETLSESRIGELRAEAKERDKLFEARLRKIAELHQCHVEKQKLPYQGTREPSRKHHHRESGCHACGKGVDSHFSPACKSCNWIICSNCGTCGCGWRPRWVLENEI